LEGAVECRGRRVVFRSFYETLPNGRRVRVDRVEFPDSVAVLPVYTGSWRVVLLRQYRPSVGRWLVEAPAGTLRPGESPEEAARRELEEEAGLRAGRLVRVASGYLAPGYSTERMTLYLAPDPGAGARSPEEHEVIEVFEAALDEALSMVWSGEIGDVKTALLVMAAELARRGVIQL
jgi:ADP-ribose pyrophosphatase